MITKLSKKIILLGLSLVSIAPIPFAISCSSQDNSFENKLLDLELAKDVQLKIAYDDDQLSKINLIDLGLNTEQLDQNGASISNSFNNEQLANIFVLPEPKTAETNENYGIFYSWDFTKKDIVSFDRSGNILFEVYVNVGLKTSTSFVSKPRIFTINIEDTTIEEESQNVDNNGNPILITKPASRYIYNGVDENDLQVTYKFQAVRKDVFEKAKRFNIDFYSKDSLINNRPVVIEPDATSHSAVDALGKRLVTPPTTTSSNETKYRFRISQADFDELRPKKGIYKIEVSPENDRVFNNEFLKYSRDTYQISFIKYYYFFEEKATFKMPTDSNETNHNSANTREATRVTDSIENSDLAFIPTLKNPGVIVGKNAEEIVKLNSSTAGGIFVPPKFFRQYSIEPIKPISIDITSVTSSIDDEINFSLTVNVGSGKYRINKTVIKKVKIKQLL
ncbi:MAG: hypothetical protein ACRC7B_00025 [Metamycoplasmataceae bacterium]